MKKLLYILLLFPVIGFSQVYQSMPQYGYGPIRRIQFDSVATLPLGLGSLRQPEVGFRNIGQVRFNTSDSSLYVWTGFTWAKQAGGGSGGGGSWQDALAVGNVATTLPVINRSFLSSALRFVNPANNRQVDILPGTGSDSLRTLTLPNKGGRIALWTPRTQCINDSLFAWDESGVRQFTGTLCVTSQGSAIVRAHNGLEVIGDSSVGIRQGPYGSGAMIYFDSVNAAFSAGWNPRSVSSGFASLAVGASNVAAGETSIAVGANNQVNNDFGVAIGSSNVVNEDNGVAIGAGNEVSTNGNGMAIAVGNGNKALANNSLALNSSNIADQPNMTAMGTGNDTTGNAFNQTLFQIGNASPTRSSIFTIGRDYMQFKHSTRATGYVLTSDANGVATWQPPSGGADSSVFFTNFRADTARANYYNTFIKTGDDASLRSLHVTGTNGAGNLLLRHQANPSTATGQTSALFADNNGNLAWHNDNLFRTTFVTNHFNANRDIRFQNKSYTVADSADVALRKLNSDSVGNSGYTTLFQYNKGKDSLRALIPAAGWGLTGNAGTTAGVSYVGTSDNVTLDLKINGGNANYSANGGQNITNGSSVGIRVNNPIASGAVMVDVNPNAINAGNNRNYLRVRGSGGSEMLAVTNTLVYSDGQGFFGGGVRTNTVESSASTAFRSLGGAELMRTDFTNQSLLIGTTTNVASSLVTMASTTKGFLPPRMTTAQRDAISSPATGLMIYNTTTSRVNVYDGTSWRALAYE